MLLSFNINPKELKRATNDLLADAAARKATGGPPGKPKWLEFPENDSISFDPALFGSLLIKLEAQKQVYALKKAEEQFLDPTKA